jgi:hypothetical protein
MNITTGEKIESLISTKQNGNFGSYEGYEFLNSHRVYSCTVDGVPYKVFQAIDAGLGWAYKVLNTSTNKEFITDDHNGLAYFS